MPRKNNSLLHPDRQYTMEIASPNLWLKNFKIPVPLEKIIIYM